MGVDFGFGFVKKNTDGNLEEIRDTSWIKDVKDFGEIGSGRYHHYTFLLQEHKELYEKLSAKSINLDFLSNCFCPCDNDKLENAKLYSPEEIKKVFDIIKKVLENHDEKFPHFYWVSLSEKDGFSNTSSSCKYKGEKGYVSGGWGDLKFIGEGSEQKLDPNKEYKMEYYDYKKESYTSEVTLKIKDLSFYEYHKKGIDTEIALCNYAIKRGYLLVGVMT